MKTELIPFTKELLSDASKLLAGRHQHNRLLLPELPARFEEAPVATKAIEALLAKKTTNGFADLRDGQLIVYLLDETMTPAWCQLSYCTLSWCVLSLWM